MWQKWDKFSSKLIDIDGKLSIELFTFNSATRDSPKSAIASCKRIVVYHISSFPWILFNNSFVKNNNENAQKITGDKAPESSEIDEWDLQKRYGKDTFKHSWFHVRTSTFCHAHLQFGALDASPDVRRIPFLYIMEYPLFAFHKFYFVQQLFWDSVVAD